MDLALTRKVLTTVEDHPFGFAKLRGKRIAYEVEEMRAAGLLEISAAQTDDADIAIVKAVTDCGRKFLKVVDDKAVNRVRAQGLDRGGEIMSDLELSLL